MGMENKTNTDSGRGCIQLLSLIAFMWGALMMFPRTVDLLSAFAPNDFMGYTNMAGWWAMGSALMIEGVMVIMKMKTWVSPARNLVEWLWDIVLSITPFILSAFAQVFDGMIVRNTLTDQPAEIQFLVTYLVPALPSVMIGLLIFYALIESAPTGLFGGMSSGSGGYKFPVFKNPFKEFGDWLKGRGKIANKAPNTPAAPGGAANVPPPPPPPRRPNR